MIFTGKICMCTDHSLIIRHSCTLQPARLRQFVEALRCRHNVMLKRRGGGGGGGGKILA